jgi:hypothetical protein
MWRTFNSEYYCDNILATTTQLQPEDDRRKLVVHADNARAHIAQKCRTICEENGLRLTPHPPFVTLGNERVLDVLGGVEIPLDDTEIT